MGLGLRLGVGFRLGLTEGGGERGRSGKDERQGWAQARRQGKAEGEEGGG